MLRVMGLALLVLMGLVTPAQAGDVAHAAGGSLLVAQPSATTAGTRAVMRGRTAPVQLTGAPTTAQALGGLRREVVDHTAGRLALPAQRRPRQDSIELPWLSRGQSGLALPVTERFFVGLGYRHVQGEDLWREFAETGSVDYDSHHVLLRAHWRF